MIAGPQPIGLLDSKQAMTAFCRNGQTRHSAFLTTDNFYEIITAGTRKVEPEAREIFAGTLDGYIVSGNDDRFTEIIVTSFKANTGIGRRRLDQMI